MKKIFKTPLHCLLIWTIAWFSWACTSIVDEQSAIVINELMPSNRTGILAADGATHDWIEIHNLTDNALSLKDYTLAKDSGQIKWNFPEIEIGAGEYLLIYASKKNIKGELCCGFTLSKDDELLQLLNADGEVVSEVSYKHVKTDQAVKLTSKEKYKKTFHQTPGFENSDKGYAEYIKKIESQRQSPLRIWEYMSKPCKSLADNVKPHCWIEIKNVSAESVNLTDYVITDNLEKGQKLPLGKGTLAPGAYITITDTNNILHGESVILSCNDKFADGICGAETYSDVSIGRMQGKNGSWYFENESPNKENINGYPSITKTPKASLKPGIYKQGKIYVKFDTDGKTIHYTIDGSIPTMSSPVFKDSILIDTLTTVRAIATDSTNLHSDVFTGTYMVNIKHSLPVVAITMDNSDLYDEHKGIYAMGPGAEAKKPYEGANFWMPWEKAAHIEFFDDKEGFTYDCGIKIFGAYSRGRPKKSFQIKFRNRYGQRHLRYDLYNRGNEDEVKSFVLRSGSQDDIGVMARDEFFTSLFAANSPTLHVQAYRPVVVYLNREYFGLYYIREKINEEFVANHLGVDPETVTLLVANGTAEAGTNSEYRALEEYVNTHDMKTPEALEYMDSQIDFNSLIDYKIAEYYTGNCDVGNIRYFKSSDPKCNQKWHWLYYDLDWGFYYDTPLSMYISMGFQRANGKSVGSFNLFISRLLQNPQFRQRFLERWSYHRTHTISKDNALTVFNKLVATIEPEMEANCQRWKQNSITQWKNNVEKFRGKIAAKSTSLDANVIKDLKVTPQEMQKYFK